MHIDIEYGKWKVNLIIEHIRIWLEFVAYYNAEEGGTPKNWCLWTVVLEKTPKSPLDSKEIKPVNLKGN